MKKLFITLTIIFSMLMFAQSYASTSEKTKATKDKFVGNTKSTVGEFTGNDKLKSKGKSQKLHGDLRSTKESVKDKVKDMID